MIPQDPTLSRREFLRQGGLGAATAAGLGLAAAQSTAAAAVDPAAPLQDENPWKYPVQDLNHIDPARIGYRLTQQLSVGRSGCRRMAATPDGGWAVATGDVIVRWDRSGQRREVRLDEQVRAVRIAPDGSLWVALRTRVEHWSAAGERLARWPSFTGRPFLTGLALDGSLVWVADSGNRVVYRCSSSGQVELRLGEKNEDRAIPGLVLPSPFLTVQVGSDGLVRVNNPGRHRVETYTREGLMEASWGKPGLALEGFCGCCNPVGLALLPEGRVVTSEKGVARVKLYSPTGDLVSVVAGPESFAPLPTAERQNRPLETTHDGLDVAAQPDGRVAVLDLVGATIHEFEPLG